LSGNDNIHIERTLCCEQYYFFYNAEIVCSTDKYQPPS